MCITDNSKKHHVFVAKNEPGGFGKICVSAWCHHPTAMLLLLPTPKMFSQMWMEVWNFAINSQGVLLDQTGYLFLQSRNPARTRGNQWMRAHACRIIRSSNCPTPMPTLIFVHHDLAHVKIRNSLVAIRQNAAAGTEVCRNFCTELYFVCISYYMRYLNRIEAQSPEFIHGVKPMGYWQTSGSMIRLV